MAEVSIHKLWTYMRYERRNKAPYLWSCRRWTPSVICIDAGH